MPTQQRRWRDHERCPTPQQPARGRQECSVRAAERWPGDAAAQHGQFVTKHRDLQFLEFA
jgi:hypothetical protein